MNNAISKEFHFGSLLRFSAPTIVMMIFMSLYTIVDGAFISRFVGTDALSSVNIVFPVINVVMAVGIMLATGGSAIIARKMGEGKQKEANQNLSFLVTVGVLFGILMAVLGNLFLSPIVRLLGADGAVAEHGKTYLSILCLGAPACMLQLLFQQFFVTAGKPHIGLATIVLAGITNMLLDYIFIVPLNMGIAGAALATVTGFLLPAAAGLVFFFKKKSPLHFGAVKADWKMLKNSCFNGSSEMVTNLSQGIITFLFNMLMLRFLGADGVASITIVMYAQFLFNGMFFGFSSGVAPVISYNYGNGNEQNLKRIFKICIGFISVSSLLIFALSLLLSSHVVTVFAPKGSTVYTLSLHGFILFSFAYLFQGMNIFASSLFTALSNGKISAAISFLRTFVFLIMAMILLPLVLEVDGVWLAVPFAETATLLFSLLFIWRSRKRYGYM